MPTATKAQPARTGRAGNTQTRSTTRNASGSTKPMNRTRRAATMPGGAPKGGKGK